MGLLEEIEDTKKQLAEIDGGDTPEEEIEEVEQDEVEEPEEAVEPADEDAEPEEEEAEDEPSVPNPTASDFARMRREKKALERQLADERAAKEVAAAPIEAKPEAVNADPEPDRATKYESWLEWNLRQLQNELKEVKGTVTKSVEQTKHERVIDAAVQEFQSYEADFKAIEPNYEPAADFYTKKLGESIRILNPSATQKQIGDLIKQTVLNKAATFARQGLDPAEELFNEAVSFGYAPKADEAEEVEVKPNLSRVAANRQRNAGTAGARGRQGAPALTREAASTLSAGEWAKLTVSEKQRLLSGK